MLEGYLLTRGIRKMSERGPRWSWMLLVYQGGLWSPWSTWSTPIRSDPHFWKFYRKCGSGWIRVDQEDQGDHNPYQQKNTLRQIRRRCALTQATSLLRSLHPVRPKFRYNALYLLTRRRVVLTPCLHLSSGSLHFLLMMAPASHCLFRALWRISPAISNVGLRPRSESYVYRVN